MNKEQQVGRIINEGLTYVIIAEALTVAVLLAIYVKSKSLKN